MTAVGALETARPPLRILLCAQMPAVGMLMYQVPSDGTSNVCVDGLPAVEVKKRVEAVD